MFREPTPSTPRSRAHRPSVRAARSTSSSSFQRWKETRARPARPAAVTPAAPKAARCAPPGSGQDTIALFEGPRSSRSRNAFASPTAWSWTSAGSSEHREPERRLGADPGGPRRRHVVPARVGGQVQRRAVARRPRVGGGVPAGRERPDLLLGAVRERSERAAARRAQPLVGVADDQVGLDVGDGQPAGGLRDVDQDACPGGAGGRGDGGPVGDLAGARLDERVGDHPGVRPDGVGQVGDRHVPHPEVTARQERPDDRREVAVDAHHLRARRGRRSRESDEHRGLRAGGNPVRLDAEQPGGVPAGAFDQLRVLDHVRPPGLPPLEVTTHGRSRHVGGQPQGRGPEVPPTRREPVPDVECHAPILG